VIKALGFDFCASEVDATGNIHFAPFIGCNVWPNPTRDNVDNPVKGSSIEKPSCAKTSCDSRKLRVLEKEESV
jgi:hypothetical protein